MKIAAIGEEDTIIGLRLAGIGDAFIASDVSEVKAAIEKVLQNPDIGLLIITERLAEKAEGSGTAGHGGLQGSQGCDDRT